MGNLVYVDGGETPWDSAAWHHHYIHAGGVQGKTISRHLERGIHVDLKVLRGKLVTQFALVTLQAWTRKYIPCPASASVLLLGLHIGWVDQMGVKVKGVCNPLQV